MQLLPFFNILTLVFAVMVLRWGLSINFIHNMGFVVIETGQEGLDIHVNLIHLIFYLTTWCFLMYFVLCILVSSENDTFHDCLFSSVTSISCGSSKVIAGVWAVAAKIASQVWSPKSKARDFCLRLAWVGPGFNRLCNWQSCWVGLFFLRSS